MLATGTDSLVERLWEECQTARISEVAKRHGMTTQRLVGDLIEAGLLGNRESDPSPADIAQMTAEIRSKWTAETAQARWIGLRGSDRGVC